MVSDASPRVPLSATVYPGPSPQHQRREIARESGRGAESGPLTQSECCGSQNCATFV